MKTADRTMTRSKVIELLSLAEGKTLGEVDRTHQFARTVDNPKITGIAGDVIEQSVLGCQRDNKQDPDIDVDGVSTELKTTGIQRPKTDKGHLYEAKEPMSITAVGLDSIRGQVFESSHFYEKINHLLIVFYLYDSTISGKILAADYARFFIMGFRFHEFEPSDMQLLKNDWQLIHDFVATIQETYLSEDERKQHYPELSSALRKDLAVLDTAPKYPNSPRFRFKRVFVSAIVYQHFDKGGSPLIKLSTPITKYAEIDKRCHQIATRYKGMTAEQLFEAFGIEHSPAGKGRGEEIVLAMFGQPNGKISKIEDFAKIGLAAKTLTLNAGGGKKEDMKFNMVDFSEWADPNISFEDSEIYSYFSEHSFLYVIFQKNPDDLRTEKDLFCGFKRYTFSDKFIYDEVFKTWSRVRDLINNNEFKVEPVVSKKTGEPVINHSGTVMEASNFPKVAEYKCFLRGTASTSSPKYKTQEVNGYKLYPQHYWVDGKFINKEISEIKYL